MTDVKESPAPEDRAKAEPQRERPTGSATAAATIVTLIVAGIVGLSVWYLARPQPPPSRTPPASLRGKVLNALKALLARDAID